jgi:hypothetical protein
MQNIENKENEIVDVSVDLRNFLESELNLDDYEEKGNKIGYPSKQKLVYVNSVQLSTRSNLIFIEAYSCDQ